MSNGFPGLSDERGTTLAELVVGMAAGAVVLAAITLVIVISLRDTAKINAHVEANQRARIALNKIVEQLHSACVAPQIAPIKPGSTGTELRFIHQTGSAVVPTPVESRIVLEGTTLTQYEFPWVSGSAPEWVFAERASEKIQLMTNVRPLAEGRIFTYYAYGNGQISSTQQATPLNSESVLRTVRVNVAFAVSPLRTPVADPAAATAIQSSALLRLTPPSFSTNAVNPPCQ